MTPTAKYSDDMSPRSSTSSILENVNNYDRDFRKDEDVDEYDGLDEESQGGYKPIGEYYAARHQKNKKKLYIFLAGLASITVLFLLALMAPSRVEDTAPSRHGTGKDTLTLDGWRHGQYYPEYKSIAWIESVKGQEGQYLVNENGHYYVTSWGNRDKKQEILTDPEIDYEGKKHVVDGVELNSAQDKAVLKTNVDKNWRHSTFSQYWVLDVKSGAIEPVYTGHADKKLSFAKWSPRSDRIAFVFENNLYLRYVGGEDDGKVKQITKDGGKDVFYGRPDWVYEEEVFQGPDALWWSQSGEYLAFLRTNDSQVPEFTIPYFVKTESLEEYPDLVDIKYPKPGFSNPVVSILFLEIESEEFYAVPTEQNAPEDDLITEVVWAGGKDVLVRITNRESDLFKLSIVDAKARTGKIVRTQNLKGEGWFEVTSSLTYVPKDVDHGRTQDGYIDTIIVDGYDHLAYFAPLDSEEPKKVLTSGKWEVVNAPSAVDLSTNTVYFVSTERSPVERHLYSIKLDGSEKKALTDVNQDGYFGVSFSSDARFAVLTYRGPNIPWQKVIDLHDSEAVANGVVLADNKQLAERLKNIQVPTFIHTQIEVGKDENGEPILANAVERRPANFDRTKKYPVLFKVYGGPVSQTVSKAFSLGFEEVLASESDVISVSVDGRGTGFMGRKFRAVVRDNLGYYEALDQIAGAKNWAQRSYVDEKNIAIWGWSYGGYMTLKSLEADAGKTFSFGMAVAPVTDWRLYDSIYTERYMHTPAHNSKGYYNAKVSNVTAIAENKRFLLMHGTGDDNVHFQNSLILLDEFDKNGVENYDVHIFPDSDHSIYHHNANTIVYDKLQHWILDAFHGRFDNLSV